MIKVFDDMMTDQSELRNKIREIMNKENLSMVPMSKKIGISHQTLTNFVRHDKNLRWEPLCKISEYCSKSK